MGRGFGRGHAFHSAGAEAFGGAADFLFRRIGNKGGDGGACARNERTKTAHQRAAQHGRKGCFQLLAAGHHALHADMHVFGGNRLDVIHAFHEFGNAKNPQSQRDNFNPVRHMQEAEGKALLGCIHVGSGNAHQQTQNGHGNAFKRRAARKGRPRQ